MVHGKRLFIGVAWSLLVLAVVLRMPASAQDLRHFEPARQLRVTSLLGAAPGGASVAHPAARPAGVAEDSDVITGGVITGMVYGPDLDEGLGAVVVAWPAEDASGEDGDSFADDAAPMAVRAPVAPDGSYRLEGLAPGLYYVSAMARQFETRYYPNAVDRATATPVRVAEGAVVEGIDIRLEPYRAAAGSITGTVTRAEDGRPVAGAVVHAFAVDDPSKHGRARSDADGHYAIRGLASARYVVEVLATDYLPVFYGNVGTYAQATRVEVTDPDATDGIDFSLVQGGSIAGVVVDAGGNPVSGAYVTASRFYADDRYDADDLVEERAEDRTEPAGRSSWAVTGDDGAYRIGGLVTGEYRLQAQVSGRWYHATVWYEDARDYHAASPVAVVEGGERTGIDMTLPLPPLDAAIAGRITNTDGHPVAGAAVTVQAAGAVRRHYPADSDDPTMPRTSDAWEDSDGSTPGFEGSEPGEGGSGDDPDADGEIPDILPEDGIDTRRIWAHVMTDDDGYYVIDQLPAGTYVVSAGASSGWEWVQRWYDDAVSPDDATDVVLGASQRLRGIDIVLPLRLATASIAGTVLDQNGAPLAGASIQVSPAAAGGVVPDIEPHRLWAYGQTDRTGSFHIDRLPAGSYLVHAWYSAGDRFGQTWFDAADSPETATPVRVAEGEVRRDVDLRITVRPLFGAVAGTVTDAATGEPVRRAYLQLTPMHRDPVRSAPLMYGAPMAITDDSGRFRMERIPEGSYALTLYADGAAATHIRADAEASRAGLRIIGGETTRYDAVVTRRDDGDGVITGIVTTTFDDADRPVIGIDQDVDAADAAHTGTEESAFPAVAVGDPGDDALWAPEPVLDGVSGAPSIAVVIARPVEAPFGTAHYTAVTAPDGRYTLRGLAPGDYILMCLAPYHVGVYYDGVYAPDRARIIRVEGDRSVDGIDFALTGMYWRHGLTDDYHDGDMVEGGQLPSRDASGAMIHGQVADAAGEPVEEATVYLLNAAEQPVAFTQTGPDGSYELSGVMPGQYRVYASRFGYAGAYNGNRHHFDAAEPLELNGVLQVDLVLSRDQATAVSEPAASEAAVPAVMALSPNFPNPFNPETRIRFTVPEPGRATLRVFNARGQQVAVLFDEQAASGQVYEAVFHAGHLSSGVYLYTLEFDGRQVARSMSLVK